MTSRDNVQARYQRVEREKARADAALLTATTTSGTGEILLTNEAYNALTGPLRSAEDVLPPGTTTGPCSPGSRCRTPPPTKQVLDVQVKLLVHAIQISAHTTITALARDIRTNTSYARAADEAHTLARMVLKHSGDIDPRYPGELTLTLNSMPTRRQTRAIAGLCDHLTATATLYPGTDRVIRYAIKQPPKRHGHPARTSVPCRES